MIDTKANLNMLKRWIKDGSATTEQVISVIDALLKAQEPLPPKIYGSRITSFIYMCRMCRTVVQKGMNYCPVCGQAVKWE